MAVSKSDKYKNYVRYAEHCLAMSRVAPDRKSREVQREMVAEWLKLADSVRLKKT